MFDFQPELAAHLRGLAASEADPVVARRLEIVAARYSGMSTSEIAREHSVSLVLVLDALRRFESGGVDALRERSAVLVPAPHVESRPVMAPETAGLDADELARLAERQQDGEVARRLRALWLAAVGMPPTEVEKRTGVSRTTLSRWTAAYRTGGVDALHPKIRRACHVPRDAAKITAKPVAAKRRKPKPTLLRSLIAGCDPDRIRELAVYQLDARSAKDLRYAAEVAAGRSYAEAAEIVGGYPLHQAYRPVAELVDLLTRVANDDLPAAPEPAVTVPPRTRSYFSDRAGELAARAQAAPNVTARRRLMAVAAIEDAKSRRRAAVQELWDGGDPLAVSRKHRVSRRSLRTWLGNLAVMVQQAA